MHELALELHMTVADLGRRASAHEVAVSWPAFFAYRRRQAQRESEKKQQVQRRGFA